MARTVWQVRRAFGEGLRQLQSEMRDVSVAGSPMQRDLLKATSKLEAQQGEKLFATQGASAGKPWAPVEKQPEYAKWKRRNYPGKKLLVWTGEQVRDSVGKLSHPDHVARMAGPVLEFGTKNELALKHHRGERFGTKQIVYLREKTPYRGGRRVSKRGRRPLKGRRWFRFVFTETPKRPVVMKSQADVDALRQAVGAAILGRFVRVTRGKIDFGNAGALGAAAAAGRLRRRA